MAQYSLELCFRVAFLAVLLPLASGACVDLDLGMGRGTIPNSNITASSVRSANTPAKNGRLNYTSGPSWCAGISDTNPYLQIDLQTLHIICAVSTQGNSKADQWVKNYTLKFSINGTTWTNYKEGGQVKFLRGNDDRNSEVKHVVYGVLARYLRFLPQTHQGEVCMRTEVFGVKQKQTCKMEAIGLAYGGKIPDSSFTASTHVAHNRYIPSKGRLNGGDRGWGPKDRNVAGDYLQIDLLYEYIICAVATQGANGINEWTKNYKIQLSLNGSSFVTYQEDNVDRSNYAPGPVGLGACGILGFRLGVHNSHGNVQLLVGKVDVLQRMLVNLDIDGFITETMGRAHSLLVEIERTEKSYLVPSKPPTDFKLTATSPTSIMASWQSPPVFARHGRTITGFILFYKKKSSGVPVISLNVTDGSTLSRNVTGLDEYTEYEFQVLAYTSDGIGPKSHVKVERTNEAGNPDGCYCQLYNVATAPSQAPSSFSVSAVTSTIITASWQLPPVGSRNGIIKGFRLFYKKRGSKGPTTILPIKNGTALSTDVSGLDVYTEYEFEVLTFTSAGDGPKSSPVVVVRTRKDGCVEFNLGMEDGRIPNSGISASSSSTPAKNGRLNYTPGSSWCAGTSDSNPYLQIDLQTLHIICAVSTQGNSKADQWVKNYTLQLSTDETTWTDYREGGKVKV
ncbi:Neuropilin-1 [Stylophora pistillata]|uniref:Neuropilin-1 n=1 Tax=Stylophora pistillata TaxID=50429 RepID=A0A2B4RG93_STYPI|nr:Neuropilin-1 [Stylophora pistillata]